MTALGVSKIWSSCLSIMPRKVKQLV